MSKGEYGARRCASDSKMGKVDLVQGFRGRPGEATDDGGMPARHEGDFNSGGCDQRDREEWANGLSHAIGCVLSVAGTAFLLGQALRSGSGWQIVSCIVYCSSLVAVYAASTLSHWVRSPAWKQIFRCWDQGLIYLLIAGTYTPIAAAYFEGGWHLITWLMWGLAITGFVSKVAMHHQVDGITLWLYLALGWLPILGVPHLLTVAPSGLFLLCLGGGLAYTLGSVMLINDHRAPYLHVGWHVSVITGSVLHFLVVWQYVVRVA